jgi:GNAT superfamily N-acetyltransferase
MSEQSGRRTLEQRALTAMLTEAFFDWKSAVVVALTLLLAFFARDFELFGWQWQWWYWAAGGAAAWGALVASMLTDPAFRNKVVADMFRQNVEPTRLDNKESRARLDKALEYRRRISEAAARARDGLLREHLQETAAQIDNWIENMYNLAIKLDAYEGDDVVHRDMQSVPQAIKNLQAKLKDEDDDVVREQMRQTLQAKEQQLASLKRLENMMQKAELQMDSTITALGTVYSQLLLMGAKDIDSGRAQRLREDIKEQVSQLHDLSASVDEVYAQRA